MKQKLGFYNFKMDKKTFWVHAVSVGEINSLTDFIKENIDVDLYTIMACKVDNEVKIIDRDIPENVIYERVTDYIENNLLWLYHAS